MEFAAWNVKDKNGEIALWNRCHIMKSYSGIPRFWKSSRILKPFSFESGLSPSNISTYIAICFVFHFFTILLIGNMEFRFVKMKVKSIEILPDKVEQWVIWAGISELITWNIRLFIFYDQVLRAWEINSLLSN